MSDGWNAGLRKVALAVILTFGILPTPIPTSASGPAPEGSFRVDAAVAASLRVQDLEGRWEYPLKGDLPSLSVFLFLSNDCPVANRYAPEIRRIEREYRSQGVAFWLVHPQADESLDSIREHAKAYGLAGRIVRDPQMALTRLLGITVTPEAAVVDASMTLAYRGRIDDRFPELGRKRARATQHDLRETLDALLAGRPVPNARTRAVGCLLPLGDR